MIKSVKQIICIMFPMLLYNLAIIAKLYNKITKILIYKLLLYIQFEHTQSDVIVNCFTLLTQEYE